MAPENHYPGRAENSEGQRLRAQNDLIANALGSAVPCPIDLSKADLRILDASTGDGYFLLQVRALLSHPESAHLIGTDVQLFDDAQRTFTAPSNMHFHEQNMFDEWPAEWQGSFDMVSQRCAMAPTGTFDAAVQVVRKLLTLVKPGGWLLLVDGIAEPGTLLDTDRASEKFFKLIGNGIRSFGLDTSLSKQLPPILKTAVEGCSDVKYEEFGEKSVASRIGFGAPADLAEACRVEFGGMLEWGRTIFEKTGADGALSSEDYERLLVEFEEETKEKGFYFPWFAAWARRV